MRRREFIALLGSGLAGWPLAARAQGDSLRRVGWLISGGERDPESQLRLGAFREGLQKLGWAEGRNLRIDYRWGGGSIERTRTYAAELVPLKQDVILGAPSSAAVALQRETRTIPVVFAQVADPVDLGLVESLSRPGGNITGLSSQTSDTAKKRADLLRELVPGLRRLAVMANVDAPSAVSEMADAEALARALGLEVVTAKIRRAEDIAPAFAALKGRADALFISADPLVFSNRIHINILAAAARLPTMHLAREYVETGGLMSYGSNFEDVFRRAGDYVDKILRGAKVGDLPIEQPTKFELVINRFTANTLGLTVPDKLLAIADVVIE